MDQRILQIIQKHPELKSEFEEIYPELKESEDEKIRNFLVGYFGVLIDENSEWGLTRETRDRILAYLEKQKKPRHAIRVTKGFGDPDGPQFELVDLQKEQKPEIKYVYPKFRVGDEIVEVTPNGYCPSVVVKYIGEGAYICESKDGKRFLSLPIKKENEYRLVDQQPTEWREEDKVMLNNIIWGIHMKSIKPLDEMDDRSKYEKYEDFLKSLPERFSLQPKVEWSEEDEKILDSLIRLYSIECSEYVCPWANGDVTYGDVVNFLKSLHPDSYKNCNSRWKPSEEQMEILGRFNDPVLKSLYSDLQKLL